MQTDKMLRIKEVEAKVGLKRSTIYDLKLSGDFPESVNLGKRAVGWSEREIDKWITDRIAERNKSLKPID